MDHRQTLPGYDGLETKSLTPISRSYLFTELFGLDPTASETGQVQFIEDFSLTINL